MLIEGHYSLKDIWETIEIELKKGPKAKRHPFRFAVLSTSVGSKVNSRWVVYRKYTEENTLLIYTDARSGKVDELNKNPKCSLLFYNERHKFQLRINAKVRIHQSDEITAKYWPGVNGSNSKDFITKKAPGQPIQSVEEGHERNKALDSRYFCIIEMVAEGFDALQLNEHQHIRASL